MKSFMRGKAMKVGTLSATQSYIYLSSLTSSSSSVVPNSANAVAICRQNRNNKAKGKEDGNKPKSKKNEEKGK